MEPERVLPKGDGKRDAVPERAADLHDFAVKPDIKLVSSRVAMHEERAPSRRFASKSASQPLGDPASRVNARPLRLWQAADAGASALVAKRTFPAARSTG
jgi:hypothetical protein